MSTEEKIVIRTQDDTVKVLSETERQVLAVLAEWEKYSDKGTKALEELQRATERHTNDVARKLENLRGELAKTRLELDDMMKASPSDTSGIEKLRDDAVRLNKEIESLNKNYEEMRKLTGGLSMGGGGRGGGAGGGGFNANAANGTIYSAIGGFNAGSGYGVESGVSNIVGLVGSGVGSMLGPVGAAIGGGLAAFGIGSLISNMEDMLENVLAARLGAVGGIGASGIMRGESLGRGYGYLQTETPAIAGQYGSAATMGAGMEAAFIGQRAAGMSAQATGSFVGSLRMGGAFGAGGQATDGDVFRAIGAAVRVGQTGGLLRPGEMGGLPQLVQSLQGLTENIGRTAGLSDGRYNDMLGFAMQLAGHGKETGYAPLAMRPFEFMSNLNQGIQQGFAQAGPAGQAFLYRSLLNNYQGDMGSFRQMTGPQQMWNMRLLQERGVSDINVMSAIAKQYLQDTSGMDKAQSRLYLSGRTGLGANQTEALASFFEKTGGVFNTKDAEKVFGQGFNDLKSEAEKNAERFNSMVSLLGQQYDIALSSEKELVKIRDYSVRIQGHVASIFRFMAADNASKEKIAADFYKRHGFIGENDYGDLYARTQEKVNRFDPRRMVRGPDGTLVPNPNFGIHEDASGDVAEVRKTAPKPTATPTPSRIE